MGKKVASDEVLVSNMGENFQVWAAIVPQSPVGVCYAIEQKKTGGHQHFSELIDVDIFT